jgi:hypothetical protein
MAGKPHLPLHAELFKSVAARKEGFSRQKSGLHALDQRCGSCEIEQHRMVK